MHRSVAILCFTLAFCSVNCEDATQKPQTSDFQSLFDSFTSNFKNLTGSLVQNLGVDPSTAQGAQTQFQGLSETAGKIQSQLASQNVTGKLFEFFKEITNKANNTVQELKSGKPEDVVSKFVTDAGKNFEEVMQQGQQQASKLFGDVKLPSGDGSSFIENGLKQLQDGLTQLKDKVSNTN